MESRLTTVRAERVSVLTTDRALADRGRWPPAARRTPLGAAPNDVAAIGALDAVEDSGLTVPADVSIVGERAMDVLLEQLDGSDGAGQRVLLPPRLVVRATTAPPRA